MLVILFMTYYDFVQVIIAVGYLGVAMVVFANSGLPVGVYLPGNLLLFGAGATAQTGELSIILLFLITFMAATMGGEYGYSIGERYGKSALWRREKSFKKVLISSRMPTVVISGASALFSEKRLVRFYKCYGDTALVISRFVPIFRTFTPFGAGSSKMNRRTFFFANAGGALLWTGTLLFLGYFLGAIVPRAISFVLPAIALVSMIAYSGVFIEWLRKLWAVHEEKASGRFKEALYKGGLRHR